MLKNTKEIIKKNDWIYKFFFYKRSFSRILGLFEIGFLSYNASVSGLITISFFKTHN